MAHRELQSRETSEPRPAGAPFRAGASIGSAHIEEALGRPAGAIGWFEAHPEAFLPDADPSGSALGGSGGASAGAFAALQKLSAAHPVSFHGVELGLGAERGLDARRLAALRSLTDRITPCLFSEHLAWSSHTPLEELGALPPPYDEGTLERVARHVEETQDALGREILLENPVQHIRLINSTMSETDFLAKLVARTGCGLLLQPSANSSATAEEYLAAFPVEAIGEIHLGGHTEALDAEGRAVLVDGPETPEQVWSLYETLIGRIGARPTLIEWDGPSPDWDRLDSEAARVNAILAEAGASSSLAS